MAAIVVGLLLAFGAAASAADAPRLELAGNTGVVEIRYGDWMRHVMRGEELPASVPPGSAVYVLEGRALFQGGGLSVRADEGDAFAFNVYSDDGRGRVHLAALGDATAIDVRAGRARTFLTDGDAIAACRPRSGMIEFRVLAGTVGLWEPDGERALSAGQTAWIAEIRPQPAGTSLAKAPPRLVARAPSSAPRDLRDAPAPAPPSAEGGRWALPALAIAAAAVIGIEGALLRWRAKGGRR